MDPGHRTSAGHDPTAHFVQVRRGQRERCRRPGVDAHVSAWVHTVAQQRDPRRATTLRILAGAVAAHVHLDCVVTGRQVAREPPVRSHARPHSLGVLSLGDDPHADPRGEGRVVDATDEATALCLRGDRGDEES